MHTTKQDIPVNSNIGFNEATPIEVAEGFGHGRMYVKLPVELAMTVGLPC
jgi:hypothetical protein